MDEHATLKQLPAYETAVIEVEYEMNQFTPEVFREGNHIIGIVVDLFCGEKERLEIMHATVARLMPNAWVEMLPDHSKKRFWLCRQVKTMAMERSNGKRWHVHLEYKSTSNRFKT